MLQAALTEHAAGRHVLVGLVYTRGKMTVETLPQIEPIGVTSDGANLCEIDVKTIVEQHPAIVVVDELAGNNRPGARHPKRYHDVLRLLEAGIDVFCTLNVYEIASRAEVLWPITGFASSEAVPDSVLDDAEIVLVDLPPSELLRRMKTGRVRVPPRK